jgi:hypothetical protein
MAKPADEVPFGPWDRRALYLLPAFLAAVGVHMGEAHGWWRWAFMVVGIVAGTATARGIEAALNARPAEPEEPET